MDFHLQEDFIREGEEGEEDGERVEDWQGEEMGAQE